MDITSIACEVFLLFRFLHDLGVPSDELGHFITINPWIFKEDLDDLQVRVNYLQSKKFSSDMITRIVRKNPRWLVFRYSINFVSYYRIILHLNFNYPFIIWVVISCSLVGRWLKSCKVLAPSAALKCQMNVSLQNSMAESNFAVTYLAVTCCHVT